MHAKLHLINASKNKTSNVPYFKKKINVKIKDFVISTRKQKTHAKENHSPLQRKNHAQK